MDLEGSRRRINPKNSFYEITNALGHGLKPAKPLTTNQARWRKAYNAVKNENKGHIRGLQYGKPQKLIDDKPRTYGKAKNYEHYYDVYSNQPISDEERRRRQEQRKKSKEVKTVREICKS